MMGDGRKWEIAEKTRALETKSRLELCSLSFAGCVTLSDFWGTLSFPSLTCKAGLITALCEVVWRIKLDNEDFQGKRPAGKRLHPLSTKLPTPRIRKTHTPINAKLLQPWEQDISIKIFEAFERFPLIKERKYPCRKTRPGPSGTTSQPQKLRAQSPVPARGRGAPCTKWNSFQRYPCILLLSIPLISASFLDSCWTRMPRWGTALRPLLLNRKGKEVRRRHENQSSCGFPHFFFFARKEWKGSMSYSS